MISRGDRALTGAALRGGFRTVVSGWVLPVVGSRYWPFVLALAGIAVSLPALAVAPLNDDLIHRAVLVGPSKYTQQLSQVGLAAAESGGLWSSLSDLFVAVQPERNLEPLRDYGALPWWTYEGHRVAFWRPVASFTHWLDYRLFPDSFPLMHLHSILWFSVLVVVVTLLYRRFIEVTWIAGLAGLLYVLDDSSYFPTMWVANRNLLLSLVFGLLTLIAHDRWRRQDWKPGAVLAPVSLLVSLLAGEAGVATFAYLFAYEAVLRQGRWLRRGLALVPSLAVIVAWRLLYSLQGYGANGGGFYFDPAREPIAYALALLHREPFLLVGQWTTIPPELYSFLPPLPRVYVWLVLAVLTILIPIGLLPLLRGNRRARFWLVGMCAAAVPFCASIPMGRSLLFIAVGGCGLTAELLAGWLRNDRWVPRSGPSRWWILALVIASFVLHVPWTAAWRLCAPKVASDVSRTMAQTMALGSAQYRPSQDVVIVNAPNPISLLYDPYERVYEGESLPRGVRMLAPAYGPVQVIRSGPRRLIVRSVSDSLFDCERGNRVDFVFFYRYLSDVRGAGQPFHVGQRVRVPRMEAEILAVDGRGFPVDVAFTFDVPLSETSLTWLCWDWDHKRYTPFVLPAVGQTAELAGPF